jgi:hypothetical protein
MKLDYSYCLNQNLQTCIHRRACKRFVGNYTDEEVAELFNSKRDSYINDEDCKPNYQDKDCENSFAFLDRFRFSDGSEFKDKEKVV